MYILSTVKIRNTKNNAEVTYTLVAENEANLAEKKISIDSPIGKGLLGKSVGDIADVQVPAGIIPFEILEISTRLRWPPSSAKSSPGTSRAIVSRRTTSFSPSSTFSPSRRGTLVIPKKEVDYFFDLDEGLLSGINLFAREVAKQIERAIPCHRVGVAVIGLEVPHAHASRCSP